MNEQEKQKRSEYLKNYKKNNPDKIKEYYENQKLKIKNDPEYAEKLREKNRSYRKNNPDKIKEYNEKSREAHRIYSREYYKKNILNNREKHNERNKKWREDNREKIRDIQKKWREENPDKIKQYSEKKYHSRKEYYKNNKDRINEQNRKWAEANKEKVRENRRKSYQNCKAKEGYREKTNERQKKYRWERQQVDPLYKLTCRIRTLLSHSITKKGYLKTSKTKDILGIDYEGFKIHLEKQFEPWMNWDNYGKYKIGVYNYGWDIDHIIPASIAKNEEELINLNHYTNLKPLCSKINRDIKKDNLITN
jgi:hypothetical protein